mmetsp:Transcript_8097/g.11905  ORF Transcript_8097/g.11905 Transcript_8097/m.11905 type:complete len:345 (+) Transcript_8097:39-1073(+)
MKLSGFFFAQAVGALLLLTPAASFSVPALSVSDRIGLKLSAHQDPAELPEVKDGRFPRRDFLVAAAIGANSLSFIHPVLAEDGSSVGPVCIIGANGKTGSECVGACIARGIHVRATSRSGAYSGIYNTEANASLVSTASCDVTVPSTIRSAIEGSRAVIFAASASKAGGPPAAVDNTGLVNVAKSCIEQKVPHLVVVSSVGVSQPDSSTFKMLNMFANGVMTEKIAGETQIRAMYNDSSGSACTYTIIRPGGLTEEEARGCSALELNQGDTKSGKIARADVASLCIEATLHREAAGGTTFECYNIDTAKALFKSKDKEEIFVSGKERRGDSWEGIFSGLGKYSS